MKALLLACISIISYTATFSQTATYTVDVKQSTMRWTGYYLFSFGEHYGSIDITKGQLTTANGQLTGGTFEINMLSLKDLDMPEGDGGNDLSEHLKSDDFFSAAKFPTALFEITKVEKVKDPQPNQPNYDITGTLTLKGNKNSLTFPAFVQVDKANISATAKFKFDRTKWNVKYNSGKFFSEVGDGAISDAIGIELTIKAN